MDLGSIHLVMGTVVQEEPDSSRWHHLKGYTVAMATKEQKQPAEEQGGVYFSELDPNPNLTLNADPKP